VVRSELDVSRVPTPITNCLTVDVEDYFHPNAMDAAVRPDEWSSLPQRVERNTYRVLDLLDRHDAKATFFVLGWVAERQPRLVREITARGHELACHGHRHRLAYELGPREFRRDVERARALLQDVSGEPVEGFRAASYSILASTMWAIDILIELGFAYDSSIFPVHHDLYGIPSFDRFRVRLDRPAGSIVEIPPSTLRIAGANLPIAGGGYLRIAPFSWTRWAIRRLNRIDGEPAIVYIHPWELDADQPRLAARYRTRLRQYSRLAGMERKLQRLLAEFDFAPLRAVFAGREAAPARYRPQS
jgi:polysaccharide deacetylase family protein (PEP-CTERM system associated)